MKQNPYLPPLSSDQAGLLIRPLFVRPILSPALVLLNGVAKNLFEQVNRPAGDQETHA